MTHCIATEQLPPGCKIGAGLFGLRKPLGPGAFLVSLAIFNGLAAPPTGAGKEPAPPNSLPPEPPALSVTARLTSGDYTYQTNAAGQALIIRVSTNCSGALVIPNTLGGCRVTSIGLSAFPSRAKLTSVTVPAGVTDIVGSPFSRCGGLTDINVDAANPNYSSLDGLLFNKSRTLLIHCPRGKAGTCTIPAGVTDIGDSAFASSGLTRIAIPASVARIGTSAFASCASLTAITVDAANLCLSSLDGVLFNKRQNALLACPAGKAGSYAIPATVARIAPYAFAGCMSLTNVTLPEGLEVISEQAFSGCTGLTNLAIPNGIARIEEKAFDGCTNLPGTRRRPWPSSLPFSPPQPPSPGTLILGDYVFITNAAGQATITGFNTNYSGALSITNTLGGCPNTSIGPSAFRNCTGLTSVTIPSGVTDIRDRVFVGCRSLTNVSIPASVTSIGEFAFYCPNLTAITVDAANRNYSSVAGLLFNKSQSTLVRYPAGKAGSYAIPAGVTRIGNQAFYFCTNLNGITIPAGVTNIGDWAFYRCTSLTSVTIPAGVISVGSGAFSYCTSLTHVTIPTGVISIGDMAFSGCGYLTEVTIPPGVTSIGYRAFERCTALTNITIPGTVTSIGLGMFGDCTNLTSITIPPGLIAIRDCTSLTSVTIPAGVTDIRDRVFVGCRVLTNVSIPASVTSIGEFAFYCPNLTAITVDAANRNYSSVDGVLFNKSQSRLVEYPPGKAGSYAIPAGVTNIGDWAFFGCTNLNNVTIPAGVISIGHGAFCGCSGLIKVTLPAGVNSIGRLAFYECTSLNGITIPAGVTSIADQAFSECPRLTTVTIPGSVSSIGGSVFSGCAGLTNITIPAGVTNIGASMFYDCTNLTSIAIPASVTSIGERAFYNCTSLTNLALPASVARIGSSAFASCASLAAITVDAANANYCSWDGVLFNKGKTALIQCPAGKTGSFTIPASVTGMGGGAFASTKLSAVNVDAANQNYSSVDGVVFNKNQTTLIVFPGGKARSYAIPAGVTEIRFGAFRGCSSLGEVIIPDSVTTIRDRAFGDCTGLTNVVFAASLDNIDTNAFFNCTNLPASIRARASGRP